jgi:hypothetical protein
MKIDVVSGLFNKEQLASRHKFLFENTEALFAVIYENEPGYWPVLINMFNHMKNSTQEEIKNNSARDRFKEDLDQKYVYSVLPENNCSSSSK